MIRSFYSVQGWLFGLILMVMLSGCVAEGTTVKGNFGVLKEKTLSCTVEVKYTCTMDDDQLIECEVRSIEYDCEEE